VDLTDAPGLGTGDATDRLGDGLVRRLGIKKHDLVGGLGIHALAHGIAAREEGHSTIGTRLECQKELFAVLLGGRACDPMNRDTGVFLEIVLRGLDEAEDVRPGLGLGLGEAVKGKDPAVTDRGGILLELGKDGTSPVLPLETRSDRKGDDLEGVANTRADGVAVRKLVGHRATVPVHHVNAVFLLGRRGDEQHLCRGAILLGKHEIADTVLDDVVRLVKDHEIDLHIHEEVKTLVGDDNDLGTFVVRFYKIQDGVGVGRAVGANNEDVKGLDTVFPGGVLEIVLSELMDERETWKDHDAQGEVFLEEVEEKYTGLAGAAPHLEKTTVILL